VKHRPILPALPARSTMLELSLRARLNRVSGVAESASSPGEQVKLFREMCDTNRMPAITPPQRIAFPFIGTELKPERSKRIQIFY